MKRTVGIAVWGQRVSTTLDFARTVVVVEVEGGREITRRAVTLFDEPGEAKARRLRDLAVRAVICGAVSEPLARAICQVGIQLLPFVTGDVDTVLAAYMCGRLAEPCFLQPGCPPGARRRWQYRSGLAR